MKKTCVRKTKYINITSNRSSHIYFLQSDYCTVILLTWILFLPKKKSQIRKHWWMPESLWKLGKWDLRTNEFLRAFGPVSGRDIRRVSTGRHTYKRENGWLWGGWGMTKKLATMNFEAKYLSLNSWLCVALIWQWLSAVFPLIDYLSLYVGRWGCTG